MIHTIVIPNWQPHSLNKLMRMHHMAASRKKASDAQVIGVYASKAKIPKAEGKRHVRIVIGITKGRSPDGDAFFKVVHDSLTKLRLIKDDSTTWIDFSPTEFVRGKAKSTTIILEDL